MREKRFETRVFEFLNKVLVFKRPAQGIHSGTTAQRPTLMPDGSTLVNGYEYFDTTLGKPIWWDGTKWIILDADGQAVPDATTTIKGISALSTDGLAITGTDGTTAMTPKSTQAKFDDFATYGTFTPKIYGTGSGAPNVVNPEFTGLITFGAWRKIGRLVQFEAYIQWTAVTSHGQGNIRIGFPPGLGRDSTETPATQMGGAAVGNVSGITVGNGILGSIYDASAQGICFRDYEGVIYKTSTLRDTGATSIIALSASYKSNS